LKIQIIIRQSHKATQRPETFDSALAQHVYDNPHHFVLFDVASIILILYKFVFIHYPLLILLLLFPNFFIVIIFRFSYVLHFCVYFIVFTPHFNTFIVFLWERRNKLLFIVPFKGLMQVLRDTGKIRSIFNKKPLFVEINEKKTFTKQVFPKKLRAPFSQKEQK